MIKILKLEIFVHMNIIKVIKRQLNIIQALKLQSYMSLYFYKTELNLEMRLLSTNRC